MLSFVLGTTVKPTLTEKVPVGSTYLTIEQFNALCRLELTEIISTLVKVNDVTTPEGRGRITNWFNDSCIRIKFHHLDPYLIKVKYSDSMVTFDKCFQLACRGEVFYTREGEAHSRAPCFIKFFNDNQMMGAYDVDPDSFLFSNNVELQASFKQDGSCIQLFGHNDELYATTLGSWGTTYMQKDSDTFHDKALTFVPKELENHIIKTRCVVITELITKQNMIVSIYDHEFLCLLSVMNENGIPINDPVINDIFSRTPGLEITPMRNFSSRQELDIIFSDLESMNPSCKIPEGLVLYCRGYPVMKLKDASYLNSTKGKDELLVLNFGSINDKLNIDRWYLDGKADDLCRHELQQQYLESLQTYIKSLERVLEIAREYASILKMSQDPMDWTRDQKKEYALVIDAYVIPRWFRILLFNSFPSEDLLINYLRENLSEVQKGVPLAQESLEKGTKKCGTASSSVKDLLLDRKTSKEHMAVVCDLDGTLWEAELRNDKDWWENPASLNVSVYTNMVSMIKGYQLASIPVFFVTGRKRVLHDLIYKKLCSILGNCDFTLFSTPSVDINGMHSSTRHYKGMIYDIVRTRYNNVLVFDDDMESSSAALDMGCGLIRVSKGTFNYPHKGGTEVIGICSIPGTGKTTILRELEKRIGSDCIYVSVDDITSQDPNVLNKYLAKVIARRPRYVILDTTFCSTSFFKLLSKMRVNYKVFNWMPIKKIKTAKTELTVVDPHFTCWGIRNIVNRKQHQNLKGDPEEARKVMISKTSGAIGVLDKTIQLNLIPDLSSTYEVNRKGREVILDINKSSYSKVEDIARRVDPLIPSVDTIVDAIFAQLGINHDEKCSKSQNCNFYRAVVFSHFLPVMINPELTPVNIPHITTSYGEDIIEGSYNVGRVVRYTLAYHAFNDKGEIVRVISDDLPETSHITLGFKKSPYGAWVAMTCDGEASSYDINKEGVGIEVFLM